MKKSIIALAVASTFTIGGFTTEVKADTPSFNFVQISKTDIDFDAGAEPDGFELKWNHELSDDYYLNVDYTDVEQGGLDLQIKNIGLGFKSDISDYTAFFAQIDWTNMENNLGFDDDGYRASVGVRTAWSENFEVKAAYEYLDIDDEGENIFVLGGAYNMTDSLAFTLDYKTESDFKQTSFGLRYSF